MNTPQSPEMKSRAAQRPAWLPAKFWDDENGEMRAEALARSYQALENRFSAGDMRERFADVPNDPSEYDLFVDDDLLDIDDDVNRRLYENGFTNTQAQLVYDLAKERLKPMVAQIAAEYENQREMNRLHEHFGGEERFAMIRPQLRAWGEANLDPQVFENLVASAEGVIAMFEMMKNREPSLMRAPERTDGNSELDLKRMMKDPRYWRERDPAFVAKVRQGFRSLYPEK